MLEQNLPDCRQSGCRTAGNIS